MPASGVSSTTGVSFTTGGLFDHRGLFDDGRLSTVPSSPVPPAPSWCETWLGLDGALPAASAPWVEVAKVPIKEANRATAIIRPSARKGWDGQFRRWAGVLVGVGYGSSLGAPGNCWAGEPVHAQAEADPRVQECGSDERGHDGLDSFSCRGAGRVVDGAVCGRCLCD